MIGKPGEIRLLPDSLANQIAAGEVIERPASVVKELVENSLDAGATRIDVRLDNGGQSLIRVEDNGHGIAREQLELALTRHATSKISCCDDLEGISSYGFRGEALPSIASVARLRLISRNLEACKNDEPAMWIFYEHGKKSGSGTASLTAGTIVEVRDLFSNTPARLKFLKNPSTELKRAQAWLVRLALANPSIAFTFSAAERQLLHFNQNQELSARLKQVWPGEIVEQLLPIDATFHGIHLGGLAAPPHLRQPRPDRILFFVNGRSVNDKRLMSAVREAYRGRQISRDYPQLVLFVDVNPAEVDVNVHPSKTEVRFLNESALFSAVAGALGKAFHSPNTFVANSPYINSSENNSPRPQGFWGEIDRDRILRKERDFQTQMVVPVQSQEDDKRLSCETLEETAAIFSEIPRRNEIQSFQENSFNFTQENWRNQKDAKKIYPALNYLGQFADTYLVLSDASQCLMLLDQHAAHERVLFNRFQADKRTGDIIRLMTPLELPLDDIQINRFSQVTKTLDKLGFACELGGKVLQVSQIPHILTRSEARDFLTALFSGRLENADSIYASMACKAAIKAGQALAPDEARELVRQWQECENADFCPHGRPCILRWELGALEKLFKRR